MSTPANTENTPAEETKEPAATPSSDTAEPGVATPDPNTPVADSSDKQRSATPDRQTRTANPPAAWGSGLRARAGGLLPNRHSGEKNDGPIVTDLGPKAMAKRGRRKRHAKQIGGVVAVVLASTAGCNAAQGYLKGRAGHQQAPVSTTALEISSIGSQGALRGENDPVKVYVTAVPLNAIAPRTPAQADQPSDPLGDLQTVALRFDIDKGVIKKVNWSTGRTTNGHLPSVLEPIKKSEYVSPNADFASAAFETPKDTLLTKPGTYPVPFQLTYTTPSRPDPQTLQGNFEVTLAETKLGQLFIKSIGLEAKLSANNVKEIAKPSGHGSIPERQLKKAMNNLYGRKLAPSDQTTALSAQSQPVEIGNQLGQAPF